MSLLSIVVITYNQENMIIECLSSLLSSNLEDVELVLSDDCSLDNTVNSIEKWLNKHANRFNNVIFLKNRLNHGTVKNIVKAVNASSSKFIKLIAGDDWFNVGAVDKLRVFINKNDFDAAFSSLYIAKQDDNKIIKVADEILPASRVEGFFSMSNTDQFRTMVRWSPLSAPANLFTRHYWETIELDKMDIKFDEDWAMWMLGTLHNMKFVEIPEILVFYRKHSNSVSRGITSRTQQSYKDVSWVLWNIGFAKPELLSVYDKIRLFLLFSAVKLLSVLPLPLLVVVDRIRRKLCALIFRRDFT